ncbi:Calcium-dependent channel 7TM region putative phosphate domain-containing protein [Dioscorea alata]|uniref:Calcium-dependent channel 7TM region putative phosphate domain-containing protein n=1 Tax=Dioscorea alata TaxID=55571 RepID=A0ACB7UL29_DIOAL|nr:Calcium-dependent channel 7TM region putative phosphate domain-containing protein [Dioscorea alata]
MEFASFLTSLGTSFVIFVVLMVLFTWLSRKPGNEVVYYPNRIFRGLDPWEGRRMTRNPVAWIGEALRASEADVIAAAGVDAAVYLVFLCSVLGILVLSGILLLPVLLPVAATDHNLKLSAQRNSNGTFTNLDKLAMGNIQEQSPRLWACILGTYWVSFVTFFVLWKAYKHVNNIRSAAKPNSLRTPEDFAVLVRDIPRAPKGQTVKDHVDSYFKSLHPDTFYRSMVITDNKKVNKIWEELEGYRKKLARAEVVYEVSKTASKPDGTRPTNRTGFLGLIGSKVDSIDHCNEKIKELLPKLEAEQKVTLEEKQQYAALIFFNSRPAAVSAAQTLHSQMVDTWIVMEAPEPRQLIWTNLPKKFYERQIRQYVIYGIVFLTVFFYMIPIVFISSLTTLANLRRLLPFLKHIVDKPAIKTILEAYLPQIALIVFMALLPTLLMFLSKAEGIPSQSHVVRATSGKYFYFIIFNVFLGVTISGSLIDSLKTILNHPKQIVPLLGASLPGSATFFLTFVALKFFVGYGLELSRLVPLVIFHLKKKFLCKTEAEVKEAWAPGDFSYGTRVPNDMLIMTVVLCYSVIAPLIIPFGVVYFSLGWLIARNQALKVYIPSYESFGRMWPHMHVRVLAALVIYQITMLGYIGLKKFLYAPFIVPLPILSVVFAYICNKRFYGAFANTSLEVACQNLKETPNLESVYTAFIPPSLMPEKLDDGNQFEGAQSQPSRSAAV